jgi:toxin HigB-1
MNIQFTKLAEKQLLKAPQVIKAKLEDWVDLVLMKGLAFVRTVKSFHDEPLKGKRAGQRSIRLNRQWRAIYEETTGALLEVQEVTPHDYRTK